MNRIFTILGLVTCLSSAPVASDAVPVQWPLSDTMKANAGLVIGTPFRSSDQEVLSGGSSRERDINSTPCIEQFSMCKPDYRVDALLLLTDQTTLIGHLTLEEYASLAEIAAVTDMYLTQGRLTVRFFGGAWPGSLLSVFETSFLL